MNKRARQNQSRRVESSPKRRIPFQLTAGAVQAVGRLVEAGCDGTALQTFVHAGQHLPNAHERRRARRLVVELSQLEKAIVVLSASDAGTWLDPQLSAPTRFGQLLDNLHWLRSRLEAWLKRSRRRNVFGDHARAALYAYVLDATGAPHDKDVADLWDMPSAEAAKAFRHGHAELIDLHRRKHKTPKTGGAAPPPASDVTP